MFSDTLRELRLASQTVDYVDEYCVAVDNSNGVLDGKRTQIFTGCKKKSREFKQC